MLASEARLSFRTGLTDLQTTVAEEESIHGLRAFWERTGPPVWRRKQLNLDIAQLKGDMGKPRHFNERLG